MHVFLPAFTAINKTKTNCNKGSIYANQVIRGTQSKIIALRTNMDTYIKRKHHSINAKVVMDVNYTIFNLVAEWPRSTNV